MLNDEAMVDYDDANDDDDGIYEDEDCKDNTKDDDDSNVSNINTDSDQDNGNHDGTQDEETIYNDTIDKHDWISISDSDNENVACLLVQ